MHSYIKCKLCQLIKSLQKFACMLAVSQFNCVIKERSIQKRGICIYTSVLVKFEFTSLPTLLSTCSQWFITSTVHVCKREYNFDLSLYIAVILVLYSTRSIDIKLC